MPASGILIIPRQPRDRIRDNYPCYRAYGNRKRTPDNLHIRVTEAPSPPTTSWEG